MPTTPPRHGFRLTLPATFRYVHGHGVPGEHDPSLGNDDCVAALHQRLLHSDGGAFLITGFRGVGKTTAVRRAIQRFEQSVAGVLPVWINAARPSSTTELLYETVRRLFEALQDRGVLRELPEDVARKLIVAYARTSLAMKSSRTRSHARELHADAEGELSTSLLAKVGVKAGGKVTRAEEAATEASFLEYSAADVEHDFARILELLQPEDSTVPQRSGLAFWRKPNRVHKQRLVVVLDELDKLTSTPEGRAALDALLSGLKNILSTRHVHFVLIGGVDLYYRYLEDARRGNSLYESVFAWHLYVPCTWDASERLLRWLGATPEEIGLHWCGVLDSYLRYSARGVTRRLIQELNDLVDWSRDGYAQLNAVGAVADRLLFYERIESKIAPFLARFQSQGIMQSRPNDDRWMLGGHYLMDWMLSCRQKMFTVDEAVERQNTEAIDPNLTLTAPQIAEFIEHLVGEGILENHMKEERFRTMRGEPRGQEAAVYRLSAKLLADLDAVQSPAEADRLNLLKPARTKSDQYRSRDLAPGLVIAGRYELQRLLGQGGMGGVFSAWDRLMGRHVAIKYLLDTLAQPQILERFRREYRIIASINHSNVIRGYDVVDGGEGVAPLIVLELLEGFTLASSLAADGAWPAPDVVGLGLEVCSALEAIERKGVARIDVKPDNIMLVGAPQRPVLVDFGIAKQEDPNSQSITQTGMIIGTPLYMSPEQLIGERSIDIRSDVWSLGMVLAEALYGEHPLHRRKLSQIMEIAHAVANEDIDLPPTRGSVGLRAALRQALDRDRAKRFSGPADFAAALRDLPEASSRAALGTRRVTPTSNERTA